MIHPRQHANGVGRQQVIRIEGNDVATLGAFEAESQSADDARVAIDSMKLDRRVLGEASEVLAGVGAGTSIVEDDPLEAGAGILPEH